MTFDLILQQYFIVYLVVSTLSTLLLATIISGIISYCGKLRWLSVFLLSYLLPLAGSVVWIYFFKLNIKSYEEAFDLWFLWHVLSSSGISLCISLLYLSVDKFISLRNKKIKDTLVELAPRV